MKRLSIQRDERGLALAKLVIVVAVIGLLVAMALLAYQQKAVRAHRVHAQEALLQAVQNMERYFVFHNSYENAVVSPVQSPRSGTAVYTLAFEGEPNGRAFTVRATPDASGVNRNDGFLEITSTGIRRSEAGHDGWPAP